jgi:cytochrome P450
MTASAPATAPSPRRRFPGEFALAFSRHPTDFLKRMATEHGDVVRIPVGQEQIYLLAHPDDVRDVLVTNHRNFKKGRALERARILLGDGLLTSEGDEHRRQRRLMQPAFHRQRIATYGDTMVAFATRRSDRWTEDRTFDVHEEMMALTMSIVGKTLFDADVEHDAADIGEALSATFSAFSATFYMPWGRIADRLPLPSTRRFQRGREKLDATIRRIISERRASGEDTGDLLSMLLRARDEEGDGSGMSDTQIRDESLTLFLAGHETTANALTWTWYLLSRHPDVESRFHAEIDALPPAPLSAASLASLPYTRMLLSESMRLYPPAWAMGRRALGGFRAGGHAIPAGSIVLLSPFVTQRDPRWFPDPERFDPERWEPERVTQRPKFSYFPFGGGPRICIGEQFAWMEGVLLLASIGRRWQLRLDPPDRRAELQPIITLRPKGGMPMRAERRRA